MNKYTETAKKIKDADAVLIGASNGLSITEGIHLFADNEAFESLFGDLKRKYGIRCLLQAMSVQWPSEEEKWGFWSRLAHHYCSSYEPTPVMQDLKAVVGDKDYFVITSNGECHFEKCGFSEDRVYEVEGNWLTMQCSAACHDKIYPSADLLEQLSKSEADGRIPSDMVPRCPECGAPMQPHFQVYPNYIPDTEPRRRFTEFLKKYTGRKLVILELGIGARNQLIKGPLMRLTASEPNATYITVNLSELYIADNIKDKSYGLEGYLSDVMAELRRAVESL